MIMTITENDDGTVTITKEHFISLDNDSAFLMFLHDGGVDNWGWYYEAYKEFEKWKEENGR